MKKIVFILCCGFSLTILGQQDEKAEIMKVINGVFEAMRTNDSTLLKQSFVENPNTFTAFVNQEGESKLTTGDFQKFIDAVGQPKEQVWNEPIWNEKVEIDGNLASVWVDYAFYIDDQFSHCGVDAFHLIKQENGWKIFHLVDTRRRTDCEVPDDIKP
ncbi:nuclear transport factor 2 family protein [Ekhidna sp.]|uniref:nuclear transport factor 2 family protein n=1 Tax=Ekhidna sp. TaxID=2608089 RepID=UPI0032EB495E